MEEVEILSTQEETQDININETSLQKQETEEIMTDHDMDDKTDTVCTKIPIENNLNTIQEPVINNTNLENIQLNEQRK
ncbi:8835_t:CDS:1, partial [Cetraspora pellucida]